MNRRTLVLALCLVGPVSAASVPWRMYYGIREALKAGAPQTAAEAPVEPRVRVLLYEGKETLVLGVPQGGELVSADSRVELPVLSDLRIERRNGMTVACTTKGTLLLQCSGSVYLHPAGQPAAGTPLKAVGADHVFSFDGHPYRGEVLLRGESQSTVQVIDELDMEAYLYGVVPRELNSDQLEAVKAQAVVSRTYALGHLHPHNPFDFVSDVRAQAYGGLKAETLRTGQAIDETAGQVLLYHRKLAREVCYHAACGGETASNEEVFNTPPIAYLQNVTCGSEAALTSDVGSGELGLEPAPQAAYCSASPYYRWTVRWPQAVLEESLRRALKVPAEAGVLKGLTPLATGPDGRVERLQVDFAGTSRTLSGEAIRNALRFQDDQGHPHPLYSTCFSLTWDEAGAAWEADGRGWGHGVGMCQWGAIGMARAGHTYQDILGHYFPGTQLSSETRTEHAVAKRDGHL